MPLRIVFCLLSMLGALAGPSVAGAVAGPQRPSAPEKLWKAYPLNPQPSEPARRSLQRKAATPERRLQSSEGRDSWALLASMAATVAAVGLAFAFAPAAIARGSRTPAARRASRRARGAAARASAWFARPGLASARHKRRLHRAPQPALRLEPRLLHARPATHEERVVDELLEAIAGGERAAHPTHSRVQALAGDDESGSSDDERPQGHAAEVELLRAKRGGEKDDVDLLKEKLRSGATTRPSSELKEKLRRDELERAAAKTRRSSRTKPPTKLRATKTGRPNPPTAAVVPGECRIAFRHGYVTSRFYAALASRKGERVVATSPEFRWWKDEPPSEDRMDVRKAHHELVMQLQAEGWVPSGEGRDWFDMRFRRRRAHGAILQRLQSKGPNVQRRR